MPNVRKIGPSLYVTADDDDDDVERGGCFCFFLPKWWCEMNGGVLVYDDVFADGTKNNASVFKTKASSHVKKKGIEPNNY